MGFTFTWSVNPKPFTHITLFSIPPMDFRSNNAPCIYGPRFKNVCISSLGLKVYENLTLNPIFSFNKYIIHTTSSILGIFIRWKMLALFNPMSKKLRPMFKKLETSPKIPRQLHLESKKFKPMPKRFEPPWPYVQEAKDLTKKSYTSPSPIQEAQVHAQEVWTTLTLCPRSLGPHKKDLETSPSLI